MSGAAMAGSAQPIMLSAGHVTHDHSDGELVPGGCCYYAARAWQSLGATSRMVTAYSSDYRSESCLAGLQVHALKSAQTTVFTNLYPAGGPRVQFVDSVADPVIPVLPNEHWRKPDVLFLGPVLGELDIESWQQTVEPKLLVLGVQGFVRSAIARDKARPGSRRVTPRVWRPDANLLSKIDVACLSEEDLVGQGDLLDRLCAHVPLVALTRERAGCDLICSGKSTWVGIHPCRVVDPTGAGDTFAAGLAYGLALGWDPERAARLGAAAASIIIEGRGGQAFGRLPEAFDRIDRVP